MELDICTTCQTFGHSIEVSVSLLPQSIHSNFSFPHPPLRKWVPKPRPSASVFVGPTTPNMIHSSVATESNSTVPAVAPLVKCSILWQSIESSQVHVDSEMSCSSLCDCFHMHVGEEGEERSLGYHIEGEGLILSTEGVRAKYDIITGW